MLPTTQDRESTGLLMDVSKFGRVLMRESLSIRTGYANDDYTRNVVRFVYEERIAVERPGRGAGLTEL